MGNSRFQLRVVDRASDSLLFGGRTSLVSRLLPCGGLSSLITFWPKSKNWLTKDRHNSILTLLVLCGLPIRYLALRLT